MKIYHFIIIVAASAGFASGFLGIYFVKNGLKAPGCLEWPFWAFFPGLVFIFASIIAACLTLLGYDAAKWMST